MTNLLVSLFKDPRQARKVMNSLQQAGFNRSHIEFVEADPDNQSFFMRLFNEGDDEEMKAEQAMEYMTGLGVPEDDADDYADKVNKGQSLMMIRCESDAELKKARKVINPDGGHSDANFKTRREEPRREAGQHRGQMDKKTGGATSGASMKKSTSTKKSDKGKEHIQATEEELHVGKRSEETGGVRVTKESSEEEVKEEISLKEEDVQVERRDVDRPLKEGEKAFQDEKIEVSESREVPVVEKESRVREEVSVDKKTEEHPETIRETVRKEHINIQNMTQKASPRFKQFKTQFRSHYNDNYGDSDYDFEEYSRGYQYGIALAESDEHRGHDWNNIEDDAGLHWETQESTPWKDFKDAVRHGFQRIRGEDKEHRPRG